MRTCVRGTRPSTLYQRVRVSAFALFTSRTRQNARSAEGRKTCKRVSCSFTKKRKNENRASKKYRTSRVKNIRRKVFD